MSSPTLKSLTSFLLRTQNGTSGRLFSIASSSAAAFEAPKPKLIDERVNNVFNLILAEVKAKQLPQFQSSVHNDPYRFKDRVLQDLLSTTEQTLDIHELIEQEFGLEISDREFHQFKTLGDIVRFVQNRMDIKQQLNPISREQQSTDLNF